MVLFPSEIWLSTRKKLFLLPVSVPQWNRSAGNRQFSSTVGGLSTTERFASWLENCSDIDFLRKLHACIFTSGLQENIFLGSKLLNCYVSFDNLPESRWVFRKVVNQNLSLWNSAIVGYFRTNHFSEVLRFFLDLKKLRGIGIDSSTLTFSLKSCVELGASEFGRGLHVDALKVGLNVDKFVGSSLIGFYCNCGTVEDAHQVFEEILDKDVVLYTTMVAGFAQSANCYAHKAFQVVSDMQREGLNPNRVTLVSLLQAVGHLEAISEGRSIHCYAIRRGTGILDEVLETSVLDMYIKSGARNAATSIFSQIARKSIASWNAMISGSVRYGQPLEALRLFYLMGQEEDLLPDLITLANVLLACSDLKCGRKGASCHGWIIRRELSLDLVLATALIDMYCKCCKISNATELFGTLMIRDTISYNVMIAGFLQNGLVNEANIMFNEMVKTGVRPNSATILSLLSAFADLRDLRKGRWIHGCIIRYGLQSSIEVLNQIIHMYAKCGCLHIAREIFNRTTEKDLVSWTSMIIGYVDNGYADEAMVLFQLMQKEGETPDPVMLTSFLQALSQLGSLKKAMEIQGHMQRNLMDRDNAVFNSLITTYAKCGRLNIAEAVFGNMVERGLPSWNTMIAAYGMHGYCREALELFQQMQRENVKPDGLTFTSLLSACSHAGLVEEGWQIFHSMSVIHSVAPDKEHYACMVDLLGRAGLTEEAFDFMRCSPLRSNTGALSALLSSCRVHKNLELGELIGRQLLELEPKNSSNYTLVSNIYAEAGKWSKAAQLRVIARDKGLKRIPGYSLIESDKPAARHKVHTVH